MAKKGAVPVRIKLERQGDELKYVRKPVFEDWEGIGPREALLAAARILERVDQPASALALSALAMNPNRIRQVIAEEEL